MVFVYIAAALAALYLIFAVGPAIVACRVAFGRKQAVPLEKINTSGTYYEPYTDTVKKNMADLGSIPSERVSVTVDGITLHGDLYDRVNDTAVIFVHGYRGDPALNFCTQIKYLYPKGIDALTVHLRGHMDSGGDTCTLGILESRDLPVWIEYLKNKGKNNIFIYGVSMGAYTAAYAADAVDGSDVAGMIIDCGYVSPYLQIGRDCKRRRLPAPLIMPIVDLYARCRFGISLRQSAEEPLSKTTVPMLFLHDRGDPTVPFEDGRRNFAACASEKQFIEVDKAQHTLSFLAGGEEVRQKVLAFINDHKDHKE